MSSDSDMNELEFLLVLQAYVKKAGSQKALAKELQISTAYLNDILHGRRKPGQKILQAFGLISVTSYALLSRNGKRECEHV